MAQVITGLQITKIEFNDEEIRCMAASVTFEPIMSEDKVTLVAPNIPGRRHFLIEVKAKTVQEKINLLDLCHVVDGSQAKTN